MLSLACIWLPAFDAMAWYQSLTWCLDDLHNAHYRTHWACVYVNRCYNNMCFAACFYTWHPPTEASTLLVSIRCADLSLSSSLKKKDSWEMSCPWFSLTILLSLMLPKMLSVRWILDSGSCKSWDDGRLVMVAMVNIYKVSLISPSWQEHCRQMWLWDCWMDEQWPWKHQLDCWLFFLSFYQQSLHHGLR